MKYFGAIILVIVVFLFSGLFYLSQNSQPVSTNSTLKNFVINQGDGLNIISTRLKNNNLIRDKTTFLFFTYKLGLKNSLQAGMFRLSESMSTSEIITKLSTSGSYDYWLKIIEGQRITELKIAFDPSLEGYLFPDSYLIPDGYSQEQIVEVIKHNFEQKFAQAKIGATNTTLSDAQVVTLASLLEREGRSLESKQHIAGILSNRLKINMALQIDASIQYARDSRLDTKTFWLPVIKSDLEINSPHNTYHNPGLPPTPICNPGYDSLYAAFHPIVSDNLFYITGNDNKMHYAKTLAEHNLNIAKYLK